MRTDTAMAGKLVRQGTWVPVCRVDRLTVDVGVAALVGGEQVALFRLDVEQIRAIGNLDPYSQAQVLSRGIVGSRGEAVFVASPMYKQPFDLRTGQCLDDPAVSVPTYEVRVVDGVVQVLAPQARVAGNRAAGNRAAGTTAAGTTAAGNRAAGDRGRPPDG